MPPKAWKSTPCGTLGPGRFDPPKITQRARFFSVAEEIPGAVRFDQANVVQRSMRLLAGTRPMAWLFRECCTTSMVR